VVGGFVIYFFGFKVSLFSLSFVIVRERAPVSHSTGSVCHLRPWCTAKGFTLYNTAMRVL